MEVKYKREGISDYQFLVMLLATMRIQNQSPIIENHELEKDLYYYYDNPEYHFLFENIMKKESIDENNYVDLNLAFQTAYALRTLAVVQDNSYGTKSANLLSANVAESILLMADQKQVEAISSLYSHMISEKRINKMAVLMNKPTRIA